MGTGELRTASSPTLHAYVQANISQQKIELDTSSLDKDEAQRWDFVGLHYQPCPQVKWQASVCKRKHKMLYKATHME